MLQASILRAIESAKIAAGDTLFTVKLVVRTQSPHVPGSATSYTEQLYDALMCWDKFKTNEIDGERVRISDLRSILFPESSNPVPVPNNLIRIGSTNYRIIDNDKVMVGNALALSRLQLRNL